MTETIPEPESVPVATEPREFVPVQYESCPIVPEPVRFDPPIQVLLMAKHPAARLMPFAI